MKIEREIEPLSILLLPFSFRVQFLKRRKLIKRKDMRN